MPTGTGYNQLESNEPIKKRLFSQEAIERARDNALRSSAKFAQNENAKKLDKKYFTSEEGEYNYRKGPKIGMDPADGLGPSFGGDKGSTETAQQVAEDVKGKSGVGQGLVDYLKEDWALTKDFVSDKVAGTLSGAKYEAANQLADAADKVTPDGAQKMKDLKKHGGDYLEKMGRGSKTIGGAKVAGYMVGASMLTDMLNPFDDD